MRSRMTGYRSTSSITNSARKARDRPIHRPAVESRRGESQTGREPATDRDEAGDGIARAARSRFVEGLRESSRTAVDENPIHAVLVRDGPDREEAKHHRVRRVA